MQFQILALALATLAAASPAPQQSTPPTNPSHIMCPAGGSAYCCTYVLNGSVGFDCQNPGPYVHTLKQFEKHCANKEYTAQCCTGSVNGEEIHCTTAAAATSTATSTSYPTSTPS